MSQAHFPEENTTEEKSLNPGDNIYTTRTIQILGVDPRRESWVDGHMGPKVLFDQKTASEIKWENYYGF